VLRHLGRLVEIVKPQDGTGIFRCDMPCAIDAWRKPALGPERDRSVQRLRAVMEEIEGPDIKRPTGKIQAGGG